MTGKAESNCINVAHKNNTKTHNCLLDGEKKTSEIDVLKQRVTAETLGMGSAGAGGLSGWSEGGRWGVDRGLLAVNDYCV